MKKSKDYCMAAAGVLLLIAGLLMVKFIEEPQGIMLSLPYVCIGIGCGIFGGNMGNIIGRKVMRNYPELEKQKAIEEKDERNILIADMAKAKAYDMMVFVFGALVISLALMGAAVKTILLIVAAYLFVLGYGICYRVKYEKEI